MKYLWPFSAAAVLVFLPQSVYTLCTIRNTRTQTHTHTELSNIKWTQHIQIQLISFRQCLFLFLFQPLKASLGSFALIVSPFTSSPSSNHSTHCLFPVRRRRVLTSLFLSSFSFSSSTALGCRNAALHFFSPLFSFFWHRERCVSVRYIQIDLQHLVISSKDDQKTHAQDFTKKKELSSSRLQQYQRAFFSRDCVVSWDNGVFNCALMRHCQGRSSILVKSEPKIQITSTADRSELESSITDYLASGRHIINGGL